MPITVPATKSITITQRDTGPAAYLLHGQKGGRKLQTFECAPSANDIQASMRTQPATASTIAALSIRGRASGLAEAMSIGKITAQITRLTTSQSITRIGRGSGVWSGIGFMANTSAHRWRPICDSRIVRARCEAAIRCSAGFGARPAALVAKTDYTLNEKHQAHNQAKVSG